MTSLDPRNHQQNGNGAAPKAGAQPPRRSRAPLAALLFVAFLLVVAGIAFLIGGRAFLGGVEQAQSSVDAIRTAFLEITGIQPRIMVNEQVVMQQTSEVAELALVERPIIIERETKHRFMGSTKTIRLRGRFLAKAGYNLNKPFEVHADTSRILIVLPEPEILSVETESIEVEELDHGLWNRIAPDEVESEVNTLSRQARERARNSDMTQSARESLHVQLTQRLQGVANIEIASQHDTPLP